MVFGLLCAILSVSALTLLKHISLLKRGVVFTQSHDHDHTTIPAQMRKYQIPQSRSACPLTGQSSTFLAAGLNF